jgi:hypothetical protein
MSTGQKQAGKVREAPRGVIKVATIEELARELRSLDGRVMEATVEDMAFKPRHFRRHINNDGSAGGFVESTAGVSAGVFLGKRALVLDESHVCNSTRIEDEAIVAGTALVFGSARIRETAWVGGRAVVGDNVDVYGEARLFQQAQAWENTRIFGNALMFGEARACGYAVIAWYSQLNGETVAAGKMLRTA